MVWLRPSPPIAAQWVPPLPCQRASGDPGRDVAGGEGLSVCLVFLRRVHAGRITPCKEVWRKDQGGILQEPGEFRIYSAGGAFPAGACEVLTSPALPRLPDPRAINAHGLSAPTSSLSFFIQWRDFIAWHRPGAGPDHFCMAAFISGRSSADSRYFGVRRMPLACS